MWCLEHINTQSITELLLAIRIASLCLACCNRISIVIPTCLLFDFILRMGKLCSDWSISLNLIDWCLSELRIRCSSFLGLLFDRFCYCLFWAAQLLLFTAEYSIGELLMAWTLLHWCPSLFEHLDLLLYVLCMTWCQIV